MKYIKENKLFIIFFAVCVCVFGLWLIAEWPGYYRDTFGMMKVLDGNNLTGWKSYLYSYYFKIFFTFSKNLSLMGIFQVFLFSGLFAYIVNWTKKEGAPFVLCLLSLCMFVFNPVHGVYNIIYNRDAIYSWLFVLLIFSVFKLIYKSEHERIELNFSKILFFCICATLISSIRQDSILLLPTISLIFFFKYKSKKSFLLKFLPVAIASYLLICQFIPYSLEAKPISVSYGVSAIINPLSYILKFSDVALTNEEVSVVERIAPINTIIENQFDYEIPLIHNQKVRGDITDEHLAGIFKVYLQIVSKNLSLFFENRTKMFVNTLWVTDKTSVYNDSLTFSHNSALEAEFMNRYGIKKGTYLPGLKNHINSYIKSAHSPNDFKHIKIFLRSALPGLIMIILGLLMIKIFPATGSVCLLLLSKIIIVFLFSPATQLAYIYVIILASLFMPLFLYIEYKKIKAQSFRS